jgi:hypothetical protein
MPQGNTGQPGCGEIPSKASSHPGSLLSCPPAMAVTSQCDSWGGVPDSCLGASKNSKTVFKSSPFPRNPFANRPSPGQRAATRCHLRIGDEQRIREGRGAGHRQGVPNERCTRSQPRPGSIAAKDERPRRKRPRVARFCVDRPVCTPVSPPSDHKQSE